MSTVQVMRHKSFLDSSLKIDGITAILQATSGELSYYTQVFIKSNIKFKKSFIKYLKYCTDRNFVVSTPGINSRVTRGENHKVVYYTITEKGKLFLEIIS